MKEFDESTLEGIANEIDFCMGNIEHPDCSLEFAGRFYDEMGTAERALALLCLMVEGHTDAFYTELVISAYGRKHYLARCLQQNYQDFYAACGRWDAFFDALAARQTDIAIDIADLSPPDWIPDGEYEDDFCYARFLHRLISGNASTAELQALLDRFEQALEGASSARLALCKALWSRNQNDFDQAFADLLSEREAENQEERTGRAQEDVCAALGTYIFVEGLGILWIAESLGLKTKPEYPLCPALARVPMREAPPADFYPPL